MDVMAILNFKDDREEIQNLVNEYREKILGKTALKSAPPEYWEISLCIEIGIPLPDWNTYSLADKAKIMARTYLKNMVETIDAHYKAQDDEEERRRKEVEANANKK